MKIMAIIPARYASTRFPGKPLALLGGKPVVQWGYERASQVFEYVAVATDDERIQNCVNSFGGRAIMTSPHHCSGTDRACEAMLISGYNPDIVVNIQGDEPFVDQAQLKALATCFEDEDTDIATIVRPFTGSYEELKDPNKVKVVRDDKGFAMYFSRSVIPCTRGAEPSAWPSISAYYTHIGLYGYRADVLKRVSKLPQSPLEKAESLEQLRWLQAGMRIRTAVSDSVSIGIDTPADLEEAQRIIKNNLHG